MFSRTNALFLRCKPRALDAQTSTLPLHSLDNGRRNLVVAGRAFHPSNQRVTHAA